MPSKTRNDAQKPQGSKLTPKKLLEKRDLDARIRQKTSAILTIVAMGIV
jgi:hypothetical protein